jgi:hypothetical protein
VIGLESSWRIGCHLHRRTLHTMTKPQDTNKDESILVAGVVPIERMMGDDSEDTALLRPMLQDTRKYLESFSWCDSVKSEYFGGGIGGIFAIFLFHILPARAEVDAWMWIVVEDIPPAYIPLENCKSPLEVFNAYIEGMTKWTRAARKGRTGAEEKDLPPVNVAATPLRAEDLKSSLQMLKELAKPIFE